MKRADHPLKCAVLCITSNLIVPVKIFKYRFLDVGIKIFFALFWHVTSLKKHIKSTYS